jgi:hypothetical protein
MDSCLEKQKQEPEQAEALKRGLESKKTARAGCFSSCEIRQPPGQDNASRDDKDAFLSKEVRVNMGRGGLEGGCEVGRLGGWEFGRLGGWEVFV